MKRLALIFALCLIVMSSYADGTQEFMNGNRLYTLLVKCDKVRGDFDSSSASILNAQKCQLGRGYAAGVYDTLSQIDACGPRNMQLEQLGDVVQQWLRTNPAKRHFSGTSSVGSAARDAWPCR